MRYTSRSGRTHFLKPGRLLAGVAFLLLSLFAVFFSVNAYTPVMQHYAGNLAIILTERASLPSLWHRLKVDSKNSLINLLVAEEPGLKSKLPTVRVYANWTEIAALNHEILRYHLGEYVSKPKIRGLYLTPEGEGWPIRLGYRGTNTSHHYYWKPSWQIRFRGGQNKDGFARQNLVSPEDGVALRNWLSMALAERWGQINNRESFARMFLNGRYMGVYSDVRPYGGELLKSGGWTDGPIFRLDHGSGPLFKRRSLWFWEPSHWDLLNTDEATAIRTLFAFLAPMMRRNSADFDKILHRENTARYMALLCHSGSIHVDVHNIVVYFDPTRGLYTPLMIDVNGYGFSASRVDRPFLFLGNDIFRRYLEQPQNLQAYVDETWEFLQGIGSEENTLKLVNEQWELIKPDVMADVNTADNGYYEGTGDRTHFALTNLEHNMDELRSFIKERLAFVKGSLLSDKLYALGGDGQRFQLAVVGHSGVRASRRDGQALVTPQGRLQELLLLPTLAKAKSESEDSESSKESNKWGRSYAVYPLPGSPQDYRFVHRLSGEELSVTAAEPEMGPDLATHHGVHPWSLQKKPPLIVRGDVEVTKDLEVESLVVEPGAVLRLRPGVSIVVRGDIEIRGHEEKPVRVVAAEEGSSWGTIACIDGKVTVEHAILSGGGGDQVGEVAFEGALSLHHAEARISHSTFQDGLLSAVGSVRHPSKTLVESCKFVEAAIAPQNSEIESVGNSQEGERYSSLILEPPKAKPAEKSEPVVLPKPDPAPARLAQVNIDRENYTDENGLKQRYSDTVLPRDGLRLKFKKDPQAAGPREIEIWPGRREQLTTWWLPEVLAKSVGLVTTKTEPLNYSGNLIFRSVAPSESLCIGQELMPGTFFLPKREEWGLWKPSWTSLGASPDDFVALSGLLSILRSDDRSGRLREFLDLDDMARWQAVCRVTQADPDRLAGFYLSPYEGLLHPLVSGPRGLAVEPGESARVFFRELWSKLEADETWRATRDRYEREMRKVFTPEKLTQIADGAVLEPLVLTPSTAEAPRLEKVVLGPGLVEVKEDLVVRAEQTLIVQPGTRLLMSPDKGIYSRGPVLMEGTEELPIEIISSGAAPFGCVGIVGPQTGGSVFRHVSVLNGSIGSLGGVRFKGMFNVYHCPRVEFSDCLFDKNQVGDDVVNIGESEVSFRNCTWKNSKADALDLDRCQAVVENCSFVESGNDGLDVSTSRVTVTNTTFEKSSDKGISVGEDSRLEMQGGAFQACAIGVQVKDNSEAVLRQAKFFLNTTDVDCYRKKSIFTNGGRARLEACEFREEPVLTSDSYSSIER